MLNVNTETCKGLEGFDTLVDCSLWTRNHSRQIRERMDLEWIDGKEVIVVGLNLTVLIPELGKIGSGFENDCDWLNETNEDIFHQEMEDVEHNHHLFVSKEAKTVEEIVEAGDDQCD